MTIEATDPQLAAYPALSACLAHQSHCSHQAQHLPWGGELAPAPGGLPATGPGSAGSTAAEGHGAAPVAVDVRAPRVRPEASLHYLLGPSDASFDPLAPQALRNLVPDLAEHDVYLCGPGPMADAATASLIKAGVPEQHIHTEQFGF
ncbi:hypothetical protein ACFPFX_13665 [Streptomyces mauvecolor]|uniref:Oxidoreductase FAD/NAD(P)-binding domain-containing protein n=1 Tax=Streptomyces mauvecolor TaxID=58345 RepID=A0ABV9UMK9_9ACTN